MHDGFDQLKHESLVIGRVEEVSPSSVFVSVDIEAPHGTSFAHGALQRFPRVNGFIVLPCEDGAILAIVLWIGIDNDKGALRSQPEDVLGLPLPRRRLQAVPLGLLRTAPSEIGGVRLERGALLFPSVGDPARLPTAAEAGAAVPAVGSPTTSGEYGGLYVGTAPMAGHASVKVSANRLFGRHLAILGNTGSGKSCSLTHLLRDAAQRMAVGGTFRAIVLDLNGEYSGAFDGLGSGVVVKRFAIGEADSSQAGDDPCDPAVHPLRVPYWLWNYREWHAFVDPSGKSQAPVLRQALHMLRTSNGGGVPHGVVTLVMGRRVVREFQREQVPSANTAANLAALDKVMSSCVAVAGATVEGPVRNALRALHESIRNMLEPKRGNRPGTPWTYGVSGPNQSECQGLLTAFDHALSTLGVPDLIGDVSSVDTPLPFDEADMVELMGVIAVSSGADTAAWVAPMQERLAVAMSDRRLRNACGYRDGETLETWVADLLGSATSGQIAIVDLSLVPAQAQQIVAAVIARIVLETLERHRRLGPPVPVIIAVEEAHALIRRRTDNGYGDATSQMSELCREAFERIGREGRKFGLSLVVSSQRPSELSETVLSQCNSYLIHRIVNSRDQDFVRRLVPDNLGSLLDEIASYPARTALLLGAAAEIPVLVEVAELEDRHRPDSADPDFEQAWRAGADLRAAEVAAAWAPLIAEAKGAVDEPVPDSEDPPF